MRIGYARVSTDIAARRLFGLAGGIECSHGTGTRADGREGNAEPVRASSPGASLVEVDALLPVQSLSGFMDRVQELRDSWPRPEHKELWFRGESYGYQKLGTFLHPVLYRPKKDTALKPIDDLLTKEAELYDDFMRCAVQISDGKAEGEDWDWDAYFLMRHHSAPTRLLDWSDGALIALHFAVQRREDYDEDAAVVYVLEPDLLKAQLEALTGTADNKAAWKKYVANHPTWGFEEDDEERSYLPADNKEDLKELPLPLAPMVLDFPHITRRVAAQRSRFVVLGVRPGLAGTSLRE